MSHGHFNHHEALARKTLRRAPPIPGFEAAEGPLPAFVDHAVILEWGYLASVGIYLHEIVESSTGGTYHRAAVNRHGVFRWETTLVILDEDRGWKPERIAA